MTIMAALLLAALAVPAWLYRGGSINGGNVPSFLKPRFMRLAATPLVVCGSLAVAFTTSVFDAGMFALSFLTFIAASTWGWLDASDLGRDGDRSLKKELGLLYVRFLFFILAAVPAAFVSPLATIPFVALTLLGPLTWFPENIFWFSKGKVPGFAVAETITGALLAVTTAVAVILA